ncbi:XkdX family protein [Eubacteriales bacterium OttesenSCG-928-N13]|nr:XkdX family protein [Eubacteriales bacterium OttesenSCG-928-N13]
MIERKCVSQEQLQREVDYARAQHVLNNMRAKGLITAEEFAKITARNRQSFAPALSQIMPNIC